MSAAKITTAYDLVSQDRPILKTGCSSIDQCIGGFRSGLVTEICGEAGSGKTQLALQLLLQTQLPFDKGGLNGSSCYLTTQGMSSSLKRLMELAHFFPSRHQVQNMTTEELLDRIYIEQATELQDQLDFLHCRLPALLEEHQVKLVIIDSIAGILRRPELANDLGLRSKLMFSISNCLRILSDEYQTVFIVINQVTCSQYGTNTTASRGFDSALGLGWSNCINQRLQLSRYQSSLVTPGPTQYHYYCSDGAEDATMSNKTIRIYPILRQLKILFSPYLEQHAVAYFSVQRDGLHALVDDQDNDEST